MSGPFDPYFILGVGRDATQEQIKAAYRIRAKRLHPDVGGQAEAFTETVRAFKAVGTPKARRRFDATGDTDPERDLARTQAIQMVAEILSTMFAQGNLNLDRLDVVQHVRMVLTRMVHEAEANARTSSLKIETMKRARDRFGKSPGDNVFRAILSNQIAPWERRRVGAEVMAAHARLALSIIESAAYRVDVGMQFGLVSFGFATSTG